MANRREVDNVYTGFCKVFGKVDHIILLSKIEFNGIRGNLLRWFAFYIINRSQRVVFKVLLLKKKKTYAQESHKVLFWVFYYLFCSTLASVSRILASFYIRMISKYLGV